MQVLAGTVGFSASLWGPKLAGHMIWAPLGRGWGGVATSVVSVGLVSGLTSMASPRAGKAALIGGLIGSFAGALSALHCSSRQKLLPVESGLLACALPTSPSGGTRGNMQLALAAAGGNPLVAAQMLASGAPIPGMSDFVTPGMGDYVSELAARGMSGYGGGNAPGMQNLLANEQGFRKAVGVNDYAQFQTSGSSASMDASPESF